MDYEFRRNLLDGSVLALFSMGHEALGRWLSEELGEDKSKLVAVLQAIAELQAGELEQFQLEGRDLTLVLDNEQAVVIANVLGFGLEHELQESMSLYDAESVSACGLEDFQQVLESWQAFWGES
ncbi:MAG: YacL family protein [Shewanella sp.]|nr:YacL family protein [Shewanella sp.]MCF1430040.1 YacL family protein [Shewanella sp.]MCF1458867.1 YacL family protein [Shewanella sp.]